MTSNLNTATHFLRPFCIIICSPRATVMEDATPSEGAIASSSAPAETSSIESTPLVSERHEATSDAAALPGPGEPKPDATREVPAQGDDAQTSGDEVAAGSTADNANPIAAEIEALRQRLLELEQMTQGTKPKPMGEALRERWERARETHGARTERRLWKQEERRRKEALLLDNAGYVGGRQWMHKVEDEAQRKMSEDVKYNMRLLRLRKEWERKNAFHFAQTSGQPGEYGGVGLESDETDFLSDYSDATEEHAVRRQLLQKNWEFERHASELEYRMKIAKRARKRERERERDRDRELQRELALQREPRERLEIEKPEMPLHESPERSPSPSPSPIFRTVIRPDRKNTEDRGNMRPVLKRVEWALFCLATRISGSDFRALDILIGDPVIDFDVPKRYRVTSGHAKRVDDKGVEKKPLDNLKWPPASDMEPSTTRTVPPLPERVRINSPQILALLDMVHEGSLAEDLNPSSLVLLRPFRILIHYDEAIRAQIKEVERQFAENGVPEAVMAPGSAPAAPVNGADDPTALPPRLAHFKCLLEFMDTDIAGRIGYLNGPSCDKITFSDLWHLFRPGEHVIGRDGKQAYRILKVTSVPHRAVDPIRRWLDRSEEKQEETPLCIDCVHLDFDGKQLGPVLSTFRIQRFEGERPITSLEIYPFHFHPSAKLGPGQSAYEASEDPWKHPRRDSQLWRDLVERGKTFLRLSAVDLAAVRPMYYAGPVLNTQDETEGQVVVDFEAAFAHTDFYESGWKPSLETLIGWDTKEGAETNKMCDAECCRSDSIHDDSYVEALRNEEFMGSLLPRSSDGMPSVLILPRPLDNKAPDGNLSEDDLVIMSYRVFAFLLRTRRWAQLDVSRLTDVRHFEHQYGAIGASNEGDELSTPFDRLVLPDGHKDVILSLVTQHFRNRKSAQNEGDFVDIVRGKGKGLIMLLHGAPGVGKTTTAEGVAEKFKKPLFQLTCGDLGTTAKDVEAALEVNFSLASRWGCILLLDEADVFLAQRSKEDFQRNGLVAVFLRVLEYYSGILFLTTNRVGDFDEAFASRIHISLYYPELDKEKTLEIFRLNFQLMRQRFRGKSSKFTPDEMGIGAFAENYWKDNPFDHWNGRQIKNACQTALALAEYEAQGKDHEVVLKPDAEIKLGVSHFETVSKAYLEFSRYIRDIYGTHAARRAKEAGLRAMWVNDKGEVVASVGPKEAGMLKGTGDRKARFLQRAQARYHPVSHEQQQQNYRGRGMGGGGVPGGQYGGSPQQGFQDPQPAYGKAGLARSRPSDANPPPPGEYQYYSDNVETSQGGYRYQDPVPQRQHPAAIGRPQERGWDDHQWPGTTAGDDYEGRGGPQQPERLDPAGLPYRGGRPQHDSSHHLGVPPRGPGGHHMQQPQPAPRAPSRSSQYDTPGTEDEALRYPNH
ncbi:uncharacterized protein B0H64DRAFT_355851 [Chaetomium fimeti]|uniref:AAA+ ATPase domain-containing protein n=1 Tax=Chaetomium fimeti TaxID=1854472 RepID=A0AAE0HPW0_9PEZI|nr:hypothetical protein B0H64DRAFT_355851 [Chaetomium fimeti]